MELTAVIIDDEMLTIQSLEKLLPMCNSRIKVLGYATNGKEAFHLISTTKPDIAIVDINMPLLNGIELIKLLKKNNLKTKVVVLSAYREFNYAQEALNFRAFAYLLKPINISSLKSTIKELYESVKNEKEDKYIKNKYNEVLPEFKEILTKKLLLEEISQEEFINKVKNSNIKLLKDFRLCYITNKNSNAEIEILNCIDSVLDKRCKKSLISFKVDTNDICILMDKCNQINVINILKSKIKNNQVAYLSKMCHGYNDLIQEYNKISNLIKVNFYKDFSESVVWCEKYETVDFIKRVYHIDTLNIKKWISKSGRDSFMAYLREYYKNIRNNEDVWPECIYRSIYEIVIIFKSHMQVENIETRYILDNLDINDIKRCATLNELEEFTESLFEKFFDIGVESFQEKTRAILMVKDYCNKHYGEEITLDDISSYVNISKNYFCSYFKKYAGDSFAQYLKKVRIKVAKERLKESNMKIVTIAKEVGYNNSSHFCKMFKEEVGISPAEFRREYFKLNES